MVTNLIIADQVDHHDAGHDGDHHDEHDSHHGDDVRSMKKGQGPR